ncbi:hypothetical protein [Chitinophaga sp. CB10]|uniref:hypothetical protein n=1 Tax=Chitinophaga sp. CB10 TaxID=1891659 RepID=UPI0025C15C13|nr:hypothetical protein [Chitinophaga sp. CB10]
MSKYIMTLMLAWFFSRPAFAQTDTTTVHSAADTTAERSKTTLTIGATYVSDASYYGQKAAERMPYVAASAALRFPFGLYFTGTGYRLLNDSGRIVSASAAGVGFEWKMGKKLTADLSYSHTFYPANSPFLQAANPDNASASLKYAYWMTTGINADYHFGKQQDVFVTLSTEKQISLGSIFKGKDLVTLTPQLEVTGGTQRFYQTYTREKFLRDSLLGMLPLPGLPGQGSSSTETGTTSSTQFNLLSYNLRVPLAYHRAHYMLEAAYQLSLLGQKAETGAGNLNSFFNVSFYYQF